MSDYRIVQCFGVKRRPGKPDQLCRNKYLWIASGASAGRFGRKGTQACPNCGTLPEFAHPVNRFLDNELSKEAAEALLPEYYKSREPKKV